MGIGKPKENMEVSDYVLQNFDEDEIVGLEKITNDITDSISILVNKKLVNSKSKAQSMIMAGQVIVNDINDYQINDIFLNNVISYYRDNISTSAPQKGQWCIG